MPVEVAFVITTGLEREEGTSCRYCCSSYLSLWLLSVPLRWVVVSLHLRGQPWAAGAGCLARCTIERGSVGKG